MTNRGRNNGPFPASGMSAAMALDRRAGGWLHAGEQLPIVCVWEAARQLPRKVAPGDLQPGSCLLGAALSLLGARLSHRPLRSWGYVDR